MTKAERQRIELEFAKKTYETIPTTEMLEKVREYEELLKQELTVWGDEDAHNRLQLLNRLNLSDRRLLIVFSILGGSVIRTATYFGVNRKTISLNINRIREELGI